DLDVRSVQIFVTVCLWDASERNVTGRRRAGRYAASTPNRLLVVGEIQAHPDVDHRHLGVSDGAQDQLPDITPVDAQEYVVERSKLHYVVLVDHDFMRNDTAAHRRVVLAEVLHLREPAIESSSGEGAWNAKSAVGTQQIRIEEVNLHDACRRHRGQRLPAGASKTDERN